MAQRSLLFIGCSFADWLTRFLIRIAKSNRLWIARDKTDVVADSKVNGDANLVEFLQYFSERTRVFPGGPVEFVDELHRRWTEGHTTGAPVPTEPDALDMPTRPVFISYARQDLHAALKIRDALEQAGIDTWLDKDKTNRRRLEAGDEWEPKIKRIIEESSLFLAIISRSVQDPKFRFFREEWKHAITFSGRALPSLKYIVPVVIDDTEPKNSEVPKEFLPLHWQELPDAEPTSDFVKYIQSLYRQYQSLYRQYQSLYRQYQRHFPESSATARAR